MSLSGLPRREAIVKAPVALHLHVAPPSEPRGERPEPAGYACQPPVQGPPPAGGRSATTAAENPIPRVLMGAVAHLRQAMLDAEHHQRLIDEDRDGTAPGPPYDPALQALWRPGRRSCRSGGRPTRATRFTGHSTWPRSSAPRAVIVGGREAAKVVDRLKSEGVAVVLRLNFPEEPKVPTEDEYRKRPPIEQEEPLKAPDPPQRALEGTGRDRGGPGQGGRPVRLRHRGARPAGSVPGAAPRADRRGADGGPGARAAHPTGRPHRGARPPAGDPGTGQARPRGRLHRPVPGRAGQGPRRPRRRAEVRDQAGRAGLRRRPSGSSPRPGSSGRFTRLGRPPAATGPSGKAGRRPGHSAGHRPERPECEAKPKPPASQVRRERPERPSEKEKAGTRQCLGKPGEAKKTRSPRPPAGEAPEATKPDARPEVKPAPPRSSTSPPSSIRIALPRSRPAATC